MNIPTTGPRAMAALLAFSAALVAIALTGLAYAQERPAPEEPTATLRVLLQVPRHTSDLDEDDEHRMGRLRELAAAIDAATPHRHERALLLAQGKHESWWASYVHHDLPPCREGHGGRCDGGQSWSPWQLKITDRRGGGWRAAKIAIDRLRMHGRRCGHRTLSTEAAVRAAISGYATGESCSWSEASERASTWRSILGRL